MGNILSINIPPQSSSSTGVTSLVGLPVGLTLGGTGSTGAADARSVLGLGNLSTQNAPLGLTLGGTGSTGAADARSVLGLGNLSVISAPLGLTLGGVGSTTAADARTVLGLGTLALISAPLGLTLGGVGSTTAADARTVLALGTMSTVNTPLGVTLGGSGITTATVYALLCGGITATSAFQSIASVGTSGQVLTSSGTGVLPVFATNPSTTYFNQGEVWADGQSGYASTNTKIPIFNNNLRTVGTAIGYTTSATLGAAFVIGATGIYSVAYGSAFGGAADMGISVNSAQLTTSIGSIGVTVRLGAFTTNSADRSGTVAVSVNLSAGDILRPHTDGSALSASALDHFFRVTRIG